MRIVAPGETGVKGADEADMPPDHRKRRDMPTRLTIRFDFTPERRLGPGKVALLEAIAETGSISAAGRAHKMSYRRAWLLIDELNHLFGEPVVKAQPGGPKGGGAALTGCGQAILRAYREAERKMRDAARAEVAAIEAMLAP